MGFQPRITDTPAIKVSWRVPVKIGPFPRERDSGNPIPVRVSGERPGLSRFSRCIFRRKVCASMATARG